MCSNASWAFYSALEDLWVLFLDASFCILSHNYRKHQFLWNILAVCLPLKQNQLFVYFCNLSIPLRMHHLAKSTWLDCELFNGQAIEASTCIKHQKMKKTFTLHFMSNCRSKFRLKFRSKFRSNKEAQLQNNTSIPLRMHKYAKSRWSWFWACLWPLKYLEST